MKMLESETADTYGAKRSKKHRGDKSSDKSSEKSSERSKKKPKPTPIPDDNDTRDTSSRDEIEELIDSMLDRISGGKIENYEIDTDKKTVFVMAGMISRDMYDAVKEAKMRYVDISKEEQGAYTTVMGAMSNEYLTKDKKSKLIAKEMLDKIRAVEEKVVFLRLSNISQYDCTDLIDSLSKEKDIVVTFVNYDPRYLFTVALERLKKGFYSRPTTWFFNPYKDYFKESAKGEVVINKKDITEHMTEWKRFYESEKDMKKEIDDFFGGKNELHLTPNFKFAKIMNL